MRSLAHIVVHVMRKVVIIPVGSPMVLWKSEVVDAMVLAVQSRVHSRMKDRIMQVLGESEDT